jgi:hypothetical protein
VAKGLPEGFVANGEALEGAKMLCGAVEEGSIEGAAGLLKVENGEA